MLEQEQTNEPMEQNMVQKQIHEYMCAGVAPQNSKEKTDFQ